MTLTHHTKSSLHDVLMDDVRTTEMWRFPVPVGSGDIKVLRLQAEGLHEDYDTLVVESNVDVADEVWTYLWSSDPDYPFDMSSESVRVFTSLPADVCDLIEAETGLDMKEARHDEGK